MTDHVLELRNVHRRYKSGDAVLAVLQGANLALRSGEITGLVGPSGSGKSTLLHTTGLLEYPDEGDVIIDGVVCNDLSDRERTSIRRMKLGFVYQFHHLLPEFNAVDNVAAPLLIAGVDRKLAREKASGLLEAMGLADRRHHQPMQMSGGEQQRVAIARALANSPKILIADEPTGNLDPKTTETVFRRLFETARAEGVAVLAATHNLALTSYMDRVVTLESGLLTDYRG